MNWIIPAVLWAGASWGWAASVDPLTVMPPVEVGPSLGSSVLRVLGALALVLAFFFALAWGFRRWQPLAFRSHAPARLKVIEARSLGQRHTLYVVGYDQQRLLIAASPSQVSLLTLLPPAEEISPNTAPPASVSFAETLRQLWGAKS